MDIHNKELSLKFYSFLCDIIGSKQVVNKRRQIFAAKDDYGNNRGSIVISSGSKGEGLDLEGSDYDEMIVLNDLPVFERLDQVKNIGNKFCFIMDTESTKPGFTKFLIHNLSSHKINPDFIDRKTGVSYLSSALFLKKFCYLLSFNVAGTLQHGAYIHGPCAMTSDEKFDLAPCLRCMDWISIALPWVNRTKYSWASDEAIQNILGFGVLFVPIGSKHSVNTDLEWRISFSYAEKQLIFCFNHVQLLCYALMKIVLKDIIKKTFGDLLCSYFIKTIMFWLCEETEVSYWRPENMLVCFMSCFKRLIYCVENETCLHYFILENNLFENRFEEQHNKLLSVLQELYKLGWTFLLHTETLQSFRSVLEPSLSPNISSSTYFRCLQTLNFPKDPRHYEASVKRFVNQSLKSRTARNLYIFKISRLYQMFAQRNLGEELVQSNNKLSYKDSRRRLSMLLIGINSDAVCGWLLLASYFYTNKQYIAFQILIDHCFTKFTQDRYEFYYENDFWRIQLFTEIHKIIGLKCLKNYTINEVRLLLDSRILSDDIRSLTESSAYGGMTCLPPLLYAHLLNGCYYCTVGDERKSRISHRIFMSVADYYCSRQLSKH